MTVERGVLPLVYRIIGAGATEFSPEGLLDRIAEIIAGCANADASALTVLTQASQDLYILTMLGSYGMPQDYPATYQRFPVSARNAPIEWIFTHGRLRSYQITSADPRWSKMVHEQTRLAGIKALLWLSMPLGASSVGLVYVGRRTRRRFTRKQVSLLKELATVVGAEVAKARFRADEHRSLSQRTALLEIVSQFGSSEALLSGGLQAVARKVAEEAGARASAIALVDKESGDLCVVALHGTSPEYRRNFRYRLDEAPIERWVLKHQAPRRFYVGGIGRKLVGDETFQEGLRTILCSPIGEWGIIYVGDYFRTTYSDRVYQLLEDASRSAEKLLAVAEDRIARTRLELYRKFMAGIIHNLKTPLSVMNNQLYLLNRTTGDPIVKGISETLQEQAERIRAFARWMSAYTWPTDLGGDTDLRTAILTAFRQVRDAKQLHPADVELHVPDQLPTVGIGRQALEDIFVNLLSNAVEAMTQRRGHIHIERADPANPSSVRLLLSDNGTGVDPEIEDQLFTPFVSIHKRSGQGLGLHHSRTVLRAVGGDVALDAAHGRYGGASFVMEIPLARESVHEGRRGEG